MLLVPFDDDDLERLMLGRSPRFQALLDRSRQSIDKGEGLSPEAFWGAVRKRAKNEKEPLPKPDGPSVEAGRADYLRVRPRPTVTRPVISPSFSLRLCSVVSRCKAPDGVLSMRPPRIRLSTALIAIAVLACLLWCGTARLHQCPNCRARASVAELLHQGGCPQCGLAY